MKLWWVGWWVAGGEAMAIWSASGTTAEMKCSGEQGLKRWWWLAAAGWNDADLEWERHYRRDEVQW